MVPLLHHMTLLNDDNFIGPLYGTQAMSNHNGRTMAHQPLECFLNEALAFIVQGTGRLV